MRSPNCILPLWTTMQYFIPYSVCFFLSSWKKVTELSTTVLRYRKCQFWLLICRSCTSLLHFMLMMATLFREENNGIAWNAKTKNIKKKKRRRGGGNRHLLSYLLGTAQVSSYPCRRHTRQIEGNQLLI